MEMNFTDDARARFPNLYAVVDDPALRADLALATEKAGDADVEAFRRFCASEQNRRLFRAYSLTFSLIASGRQGVPDWAGDADRDVATIVAATDLPKARSVPRQAPQRGSV